MGRISIVTLRFPWPFCLLKVSRVWKDRGDVYHFIRQQDLSEHLVDRMFTACCGSGSALSLARSACVVFFGFVAFPVVGYGALLYLKIHFQIVICVSKLIFHNPR